MRRFIADRWPMLLGLLVALVIWRWPAGPVWRVETTEKVLGFSRDGRTVFTLLASWNCKDNTSWNHKESALIQHRDVVSGQLTDSTDLLLGPITTDWIGCLSADRMTLLVRAPVLIESGESLPSFFFLVDASSGKPRVGLMSDIEHVNPGSFSEDGRWLWAYHQAADSGDRLHEIDILSTTTGEVMLGLRPDDERYPWSCRFSKDGNRVAVLWRPLNEPQCVASQVRVIDVTSGREDRRFDLPAGKWQSINQWNDRSMILEISVPDGDTGYFRRCREFELSSSTLSDGVEKPLLTGYVINVVDGQPHGQTWWEDGPGWLVYLTSESIPVTNWQATLSRVDGVLGTRLLQTKGDQRLKVRRVNPVSGWTISEIPSISFGWQPRFSDDGRWLAVEVRGGIELWDTLPPPRWPWAISTVAFTAFGVAFLRRRFRAASRSLSGTP